MRFDEIWIQPPQLEKTAWLAQVGLFGGGAAVEIGSWQGLSAVAIANAIHPCLLHVVDHWKGSEDIPQEKSSRDNYAIFQANMAEGTQGNYDVHKEDWRDFAKTWDKPIGFLHLDAGHGADEVEECLRALLPYSMTGGVFAGDDWNWPTVREGVLRVFPPTIVSTFMTKLWWVNF